MGAPGPVGGAGEGAGVGASFEGLLLSGLFPDPASDEAPIILCILCTITMACINCCGGSWPELLLLNNGLLLLDHVLLNHLHLIIHGLHVIRLRGLLVSLLHCSLLSTDTDHLLTL